MGQGQRRATTSWSRASASSTATSSAPSLHRTSRAAIGVNRDILVFVHGFNTSYDEARSRAAQIVADARFGGVAVLFTWPSRSELFGYVSDKDSATASRDALQALLHDLGQTPGVGKIHVLAHSMGGWLSMEALRAVGDRRRPDLSGHLGDVILASPDIDMDVFASQMARIRPANVTVFATPNDERSRFRARWRSRQRLGAIDASKPEDRAEIESLGAKVVDITAYADADRFISHAVYADLPEVLKAIGATIAARGRRTPTRSRTSTRRATRTQRRRPPRRRTTGRRSRPQAPSTESD